MIINSRVKTPGRIIRSISRISLSRIREISLEKLEKTYSERMTASRSTLSTLREKRTLNSSFINPLLASKVLKIFILPILKEKLQRESESLKNLTRKKKTQVKKVEDNGLSGLLKKKVNECSLELKKLRTNLDKVLIENAKIKEELEKYKEDIENHKINQTLISNFPTYIIATESQAERYKNKISVKALEYKIALQTVLKHKYSLSSKLSKENSQNYILKHSKTKNKIHKEENTLSHVILGDHLHKIFLASEKLKIPFGMLSKISSAINNTGISRYLYFDLFIKTTDKNLSEYSFMIKNIIDKNNDYFSIRKKAKLNKVNIIANVNIMIQKLHGYQSESVVFREAIENKHKALEELKIEFDATRKKVVEKQGGSAGKTDFICKNCYQSYKETENFNWSCKRHTSEWSGEVYWCCGKSTKSSLGCFLSKHISDLPEEQEFDDQEIQKITEKEFCLTCKKTGHNFKACTKDPNHKTFNPRSRSQLNLHPNKLALRKIKSRPFDEIEKLKINLSLNLKTNIKS